MHIKIGENALRLLFSVKEKNKLGRFYFSVVSFELQFAKSSERVSLVLLTRITKVHPTELLRFGFEKSKMYQSAPGPLEFLSALF